jgi:hypothetical protein
MYEGFLAIICMENAILNYLPSWEIKTSLPLLQDSFRGLQECIPNLRGDKTSRAQVCCVDDDISFIIQKPLNKEAVLCTPTF